MNSVGRPRLTHLLPCPSPDILVVFPIRIPIPRAVSILVHKALVKARLVNELADDDDSSPAKARRHLELGLNTAPVLAVLVLLASSSISGATVRRGIAGSDGGVHPYDISQSEKRAANIRMRSEAASDDACSAAVHFSRESAGWSRV